MDESDFCHHENNGDGFCLHCFQELTDVSQVNKRITAQKKLPSIAADLALFHAIPQNVRQLADAIFQECEFQSHRGERRKEVIIFCLYTAYNRLNLTYNFDQLSNIVGLKTSRAAAAITRISAQQIIKPNSTLMDTGIKIDDPLKHLVTLGNAVDLKPDQIASLQVFSEQKLKEFPDLPNQSPIYVATALICLYLYMRSGCKELDLNVISKLVKVPVIYIKPLYDTMCKQI